MSTANTDPHALTSDGAHHDVGETEDRFSLGAHKASYDDVNVPVLVVVGFVSAVLTFVTICGAQALYYHYENGELVRKLYGTIRTPQTAITEEQQAKLGTFGHTIEQIDTAEGKAEQRRITIPLSEAISTTLEEQKQAQEAAFPASSK